MEYSPTGFGLRRITRHDLSIHDSVSNQPQNGDEKKRTGLSTAKLGTGRLDSMTYSGGRNVWVDGFEGHWYFEPAPQDAKGDGTVSPVSGAAPKGRPGVKRVFKTQGYDHQNSYNNEPMAQLTQYLIAKMVAEKVKT